MHLSLKLGYVKALSSLDGRRSIHWKDRGFFGLHKSQAHHVVSQVEGVLLGPGRNIELILHHLALRVKVPSHSRFFMLQSFGVLHNYYLRGLWIRSFIVFFVDRVMD